MVETMCFSYQQFHFVARKFFVQAAGVKRKRSNPLMRLTDLAGFWTLRQYNRYVDLFVLAAQAVPFLLMNRPSPQCAKRRLAADVIYVC